MFADSLIETSWPQRSRRSWTTLTSFALQAVIVGLLLLLPLFTPEGLPMLRRLATPISASRLPAEAPPTTASPSVAALSNYVNGRLMTPTYVPISVTPITDDVAPPQAESTGPYVPGLGRIGDMHGDPFGIAVVRRPVIPAPPPPAVAHTIRLSHMSEGDLIRKVQPIYPPLARSARIQGQVVLAAMIGKEGAIEHLHVLSGHPMLVQAALDAVQQWRYRPYILNNDPVEVETQIVVNFSLSGS